MPKPAEELRGREAITRGTIEIVPTRKGWTVRYKNLKGYTQRHNYAHDKLDAAIDQFWKHVEQLREEIRNGDL